MTWEKTVLIGDALRPYIFTGKGEYRTPWSIAEKVAKAQAEISFKAGEAQAYKKWEPAQFKAEKLMFQEGYKKRKSEEATVSLADMCMKHRKFGIETVVEFMEEREQDDGVDELYYFVIEKYTWQAKKKEWGIDGTN